MKFQALWILAIVACALLAPLVLIWHIEYNTAVAVTLAAAAVTLNLHRMNRLGSRRKSFKTMALVTGMVAAVIPAEMLYCKLNPQFCGVEGWGTFIVYLALPPLITITVVSVLLDLPGPKE